MNEYRLKTKIKVPVDLTTTTAQAIKTIPIVEEELVKLYLKMQI